LFRGVLFEFAESVFLAKFAAEEVARRRRGEEEKREEFLAESLGKAGEKKLKPRLREDERGFMRLDMDDEDEAGAVEGAGKDGAAGDKSVASAPAEKGAETAQETSAESSDSKPAGEGTSWRRVAVVEDASDDESDEEGGSATTDSKKCVAKSTPKEGDKATSLPSFNAESMSEADFERFVRVLKADKDERILFCAKVGTNRSKLDVLLSDLEVQSVKWKKVAGEGSSGTGIVSTDGASQSGSGGHGAKADSSKPESGAKSKNKKRKAAEKDADEKRGKELKAAEKALSRSVKAMTVLCAQSDFHCELCSRGAKHLWPAVASEDTTFRYDVLCLLEEMSQRKESAVAMAVRFAFSFFAKFLRRSFCDLDFRRNRDSNRSKNSEIEKLKLNYSNSSNY